MNKTVFYILLITNISCSTYNYGNSNMKKLNQQIFINDFNNKTFVFDCNPLDKISFIKSKILDQIGLKTENQILIDSSGKIIDNIGKTLNESNIKNHDTLNVFARIRGGGNKSGLNFLTLCTKCKTESWLNIEGTGTFDIADEMHQCIQCNKLLDIKAIGLINCEYTIKGNARNYKNASKQGEIGDVGFQFDLDKYHWYYLKVIIHKLKKSESEQLFDLISKEVSKPKNKTVIVINNNSFNDNSICNSFNKQEYKQFHEHKQIHEHNDNSFGLSFSLF